VAIYTAMPAQGARGVNISYWDYVAWRKENRTFADVGMWTWSTITVSTDNDAERIESALVSPNLFPLLGITPLLGRSFTADEERAGNDRVILLGHGLWQRRYGGDREIVGKSIRVNAVPYTVVGVMPPNFNFPAVGQAWRPLPQETEAADRGNRFYAGAIGRLKDGVTLQSAQADLDRIMRDQQAAYPKDYDGFVSDAITLRDDIVGDLRRPLLVFLGAVAMVLLIICANVANLMLARGAERRREVGIRVALGAGRGRIVRHVLLESALIVSAGGIAGGLLVPLGLRLFTASFPGQVPFYYSFGVDPTVIAFVAVVSLLSGFLLGLVPALRASDVDVGAALKEGSRGQAGGRQGSRLRDGIVVAELALSVMLLVGATLLIRSYRALTDTKLGFDEKGLLAVSVSLPGADYRDRERRRVYWENAYQRLSALPGVEAVGSANGIPFSGWNVQSQMTIEGRPAQTKSDELIVHYQNVSPDYFKAIGAPIVRGRSLTSADRDSAVYVGVINEVLVRREFAGQDPIGKRIRWGDDPNSTWPWITIVGVVRDFRHFRLPEPMLPAVFLSQLAQPSTSQTIVLRTKLDDPRTLEPAVRAALRDLNKDAPAYQVQTFEQVVSTSLWRQRLQGQVLGIFAVMAMLLAAIGIYGVISYAVAQRTREMGVRMALGAKRTQVAMLVLRQGARLALVGVAIGITGALLLRGTVSQLLYGIAPTDPLTFIGVPLSLATVAVLASLLPAQRATRVDPVVAMKAD
jgi:putative ABC transport system permease protein